MLFGADVALLLIQPIEIGVHMRTVAFLIFSIALCNVAKASIIYTSDGFFPALSCGDYCVGHGSDYSFGSISIEQAQQFVLNHDTFVDGVDWVGSQYAASDFTINIFNTTIDGLPAINPLASFHIGSNYNAFSAGSIVSLFSADIDEIKLFADVPYFMSIVNDDPLSRGWGWSRGTASDGRGEARATRDSRFGDDWHAQSDVYSSYSLGFALEGRSAAVSVPEPSSIWLLGAGTIGLYFKRRKLSA